MTFFLLIFTFTWTLSTTWWQMRSVILQFQLNRDKLSLSTLRSIQGLHAPLKLQMEYRAAQQVIAPDLSTFNSCWKFAQLSFYLFFALSRSSGCHFYPVQTWLWILFGEMMTPSALKTSSMVRIWSPSVPDNSLNIVSWCLFCHLADPAQSELMGDPHLMVEYKLGLLWRLVAFRNEGAGGVFRLGDLIECYPDWHSSLRRISNKYFWFCLKFTSLWLFFLKIWYYESQTK